MPMDKPTRLTAVGPPRTDTSTAARIAGRIREEILEGKLLPGAQLVEMRLSAELGVSRGPVREALQHLLQEGLLWNDRNRGVFVKQFNAEDITDVYFIRELIETAAASLLVRSNRQRLRTVRAALDDMLKVEESGIWRNIVEADLRFHAAIVSAAGSVRLNRIFETLQAETRMCLNRLAPFYPDRRDVLSEHVEIFEALEAGASTQVVSLLRRHMRDSCQRLTQAEVHSKSVRSRRETVADSV